MRRGLFHNFVLFAALGALAVIPSIVLMEGMVGVSDNAAVGDRLFDIVPPLGVGVCLWLASRWTGLLSPGVALVRVVVLVAAAGASWYTAREIYLAVEGSLAEPTAGAVGGLILAVPLPWLWGRLRTAPMLLLAAAAAGVAGVALSLPIREVFEEVLRDNDRWLYVLMTVWQATVFASVAAVGWVYRWPSAPD